MLYRRMEMSDYDQLVKLWQACPETGLCDLDDSREGIARLLAEHGEGCLVEEEDGAIRGAILMRADGGTARIYHAVLPEYRTGGTGFCLLGRALLVLARRGVHKIDIRRFCDSDAEICTRRFWIQRGFEVDDSHLHMGPVLRR